MASFEDGDTGLDVDVDDPSDSFTFLVVDEIGLGLAVDEKVDAEFDFDEDLEADLDRDVDASIFLMFELADTSTIEVEF